MGARRLRQRVWFERWVKEGYCIRQLSDQSGCSGSTLRRIIAYWLERSPRVEIDFSRFRYLVIDGSYLKGRHTAVVGIADPTQNRIVTGWYGVKEGSNQMVRLCHGLAEQGLAPVSVTIDGLPQVHDMVRMLWPQALVQRCLVHIQRQGLAWCRHHPRRTDARHLRLLFLRVCSIRTTVDRDAFLKAWLEWEDSFGMRIDAQKERGRVFSDLKRARSMLSKALPYMFTYLSDPMIPTSTNWLESYFSRLKSRYRQHRGLSPHQRASYFRWYFYLCQK
ncbi:MAG: transposase [Candidatus Zixiibacteriota bacterium]